MYFQEILELLCLSFKAFFLREKFEKDLVESFPGLKTQVLGLLRIRKLLTKGDWKLFFYKKKWQKL